MVTNELVTPLVEEKEHIVKSSLTLPFSSFNIDIFGKIQQPLRFKKDPYERQLVRLLLLISRFHRFNFRSFTTLSH